MKNKFFSKPFNRYWLISLLGVLVASFYPIYMGVRVISEMIANGTVLKENYPKYIIPYTPISIAIIIGVLLLPLCIKLFKNKAFWATLVLAVGVFFGTELLFENNVVINSWETQDVTILEQKEVNNTILLKDWQMVMCAAVSPIVNIFPQGQVENVFPQGQVILIPQGGIQTLESTTKVNVSVYDILGGNYDPAFKMHFYMISLIIIITVLNCVYGFGHMIKNQDNKRKKSLILQSVCSALFLGLCILACFTAFWRDGSIQVSALSAFLMALFFILMGMTAGIFAGSFLLGKKKLFSVWIPGIVSAVVTLLMYVGEMILLSGNLYRFGSGFLFDGLPAIALAPIDILIILISGGATALLFVMLNRNKKQAQTERDAENAEALTV